MQHDRTERFEGGNNRALNNSIRPELRAHWPTLLPELIEQPRLPAGTTSPCGAVLLGTGRTADVWGFADYAIKLFRHRVGLHAPSSMAAEIATYKRLALSNDSGLPRLYAHGEVDGPEKEANACGWAIYSRISGQPLSFATLQKLPPPARSRLVCDLLEETLNLESLLNAVEPLMSWNDNYSDVRIERLRRWRESSKISADDLALAETINTVIQSERSDRRYIHGDFNPPNIMADLSNVTRQGSIIKFLDPMISYDAAESNWRHFTLFPDLADTLARNYSARTATAVNSRLMYAIGAFTHLYNALAEPAQAIFRRPALKRCLERIDKKP